MPIKSEKEALASIVPFTKHVGGKPYEGFFCYIGTDARTHRKISFWKASKDDLKDCIAQFYENMQSGATPEQAKSISAKSMADYMLGRDVLDSAGFHDVSFAEVARAWVRIHGSVDSRKTIGAAFEEYVDSFPEVQAAHRESIGVRVGAFVRAIGYDRTVSSISTQDADGYLRRAFCNSAPKTYNNHLSYIKSFFNWCKAKPRQYCANNPMEDLKTKTIQYEEPEFVDAPAVRKAFAYALQHPDVSVRNQYVWNLALSFFAGIRSEEIHRLRVMDVDVEHGEARVATPKGFQHGVQPRMVELTEAAIAWMRAYPLPYIEDGSSDPEDQLLPAANPKNGVMRYIAKRARLAGDREALPHNAGRHSFATMHVALYRDPVRTEAVMGTSHSMRVRNYMGLATKEQAQAYFHSVRPAAEAPAEPRQNPTV